MTREDQVLVSRTDLMKLVEFQKTLDGAFSEMHALFIVLAERSDKVGTNQHLAYLGATHASNWQDYCIDSDGSVERLENALDTQYKGDSK